MEEQFTQGMLEPGLRIELIKLLKDDTEVRKSVLDIVATQASVSNVVPEPEPEPEPVAVATQPPLECPHDPLRDQLNAPLKLLETLCADEGLSSYWLVEGESEGLQLTRLWLPPHSGSVCLIYGMCWQSAAKPHTTRPVQPNYKFLVAACISTI